jgi:murein DD-endopeptidase MepM/ murein hydrolase activator NlpD
VREGLVALLFGWVALVQPVDGAALVVHRDFPVAGKVSYGRAHHDYPATDIWAGCGRPALSPVDGTVLEVERRDRWRPATNLGRDRGGRFVSIRGDDGVRYYGSHLRRVRPGLHAGVRVRAGQRIGRVGHSGNARYVGCQLHFGLSPVCRGTGQWWIRRGVVSPYRFLRSWQQGGSRSPRHAVRVWKQRHGCPAHPSVDP